VRRSGAGGGPAAQPPKLKRLLVIGEVKGFQHDSVSPAMATMWKLGKETGLWETYIKTDTQLITKEEAARQRQEPGLL